MGYLFGGIDCVHLVRMRSRNNTYEWKLREFIGLRLNLGNW
jgi:hypothetical protein